MLSSLEAAEYSGIVEGDGHSGHPPTKACCLPALAPTIIDHHSGSQLADRPKVVSLQTATTPVSYTHLTLPTIA